MATRWQQGPLKYKYFDRKVSVYPWINAFPGSISSLYQSTNHKSGLILHTGPLKPVKWTVSPLCPFVSRVLVDFSCSYNSCWVSSVRVKSCSTIRIHGDRQSSNTSVSINSTTKTKWLLWWWGCWVWRSRSLVLLEQPSQFRRYESACCILLLNQELSTLFPTRDPGGQWPSSSTSGHRIWFSHRPAWAGGKKRGNELWRSIRQKIPGLLNSRAASREKKRIESVGGKKLQHSEAVCGSFGWPRSRSPTKHIWYQLGMSGFKIIHFQLGCTLSTI